MTPGGLDSAGPWAWHVDPALERWALPLVGGVSDELFGYFIAVHDQPV